MAYNIQSGLWNRKPIKRSKNDRINVKSHEIFHPLIYTSYEIFAHFSFEFFHRPFEICILSMITYLF